MPQALTDLERRALDFIVEYLRENTYQPSIREIGRRFGLKSTKTVSELLHSIETKGYIQRDPSRSRGVRLLGLDLRSQAVSVPVLSPQGDPIDRFFVDRRLSGPAGCYFLEMRGNELMSEGIRAGDLVLVEPVSALSAAHGELVVHDADNTSRIGKANGGAAAQGRVIGVLRRMRSPAQPSVTGEIH